MKRLLMILAVCIASLMRCFGQADTTVCFVNIYPGSDIYELEGHSAILVEIGGRSLIAYNFGVFDFDAPNFVYRFVKGETDYMAVAQPGGYFLNSYIQQRRRIVAHELNLDSAQKKRLLDMLNEKIRPENRVYRYNYVKDNCATRPLGAVEAAIGDSIILAPAPSEAQSSRQVTFRNIMRHYHRNYPWYQFGIDLALGSGIDYPLSRREMAFAPSELDAMLPGARAGGKPLVKNTEVINDTAPEAAIQGPTPWYLTPMCVCWAFFALTLALTIRDIRRRKVTVLFDAVYFGLLGLTGCLLSFLIFVSVHEATSPNWLYLWLNPLCFIPTIFIRIKKARTFVMCYQITNFVVLLALCATWPLLPQSANAAFIPLVGAELMRSFSYIYITRYNKC